MQKKRGESGRERAIELQRERRRSREKKAREKLKITTQQK